MVESDAMLKAADVRYYDFARKLGRVCVQRLSRGAVADVVSGGRYAAGLADWRIERRRSDS